MERWRKTTKALNKNSRSPIRYLYLVTREYKHGSTLVICNCMERWRKTTKALNQNSRSPNRYLYLVTHEYKQGSTLVTRFQPPLQ